MGCGCSEGVPWAGGTGPGFKGQKTGKPYGDNRGGSAEPPYNRTCPQYFRRSPFFLHVMDELDDYREGRLGDVQHFEFPRLFYLRVANAEMKAWEQWEMEDMQAKA